MYQHTVAPDESTGYQPFEGKPYCDYIPEIHVADRHLHKEIEIAFVNQGKLTVRLMDEINVSVSQGEFICISGSTLHKYMEEEPGTRIVKAKFMKSWLFLPFMDDSEKETCQHLLSNVFVSRPDPAFREIFTRNLQRGLKRYRDILTFSMILELTAYLLNHPESIREEIQTNITDTLHMEQLLTYMQSNYNNPDLTLSMLAGHMNLSESYCSRFFSKTVRMTFMEYLNALRTNNVKYMLVDTDLSITEIQQRSGFGSIQTFNRVFKQQAKVSPSEFRQKHRRVP
ncbi:MAG: helix-turn-helix transcriptional regulator [Eubacteriales bacterium]|nr:helix-turn-helix transcriptional regulator [Eubacteriales bacterium]